VGYFKRKLDRGHSRRLVRGLNDAAVDGKAWEAIPGRPPRAHTFVRFSARDQHQESGRRRGIFAAAYDLLEAEETDPIQAKAVDDALEWFRHELPIPELRDARAIFLFRTEATACMRHIWTLVHALREAGVWVEMQTVPRPGRIVYQDAHQIAVLPWADAGEL